MSKARSRKHFGEEIIGQVLTLRQEGKTNRQIAIIFQLKNATSVKNLLARYREKERKMKLGIPIRKKGRPPKCEETLEKDELDI